MISYTERILGARIRGKDKSAHDVCIKDVELDEFVLGPVEHASQNYSLTNSSFRNIRISGAFLVYEGVRLENVVFEDVTCSDALTLSNLSRLASVKFVGNKGGKGLWIKPLDNFSSDVACGPEPKSDPTGRPPETMVDITQFYGDDVEILGLPIDKVRFDHSRHFAIDSRWNAIQWDEYGIEKSSFWRMRFRRLPLFEVETGIFELPTSRSKNYEAAIRDSRRLLSVYPGTLPVL